MAVKWIGTEKGLEGLHGIPARDLTDEEVERYGGEEFLVSTGCYAATKPKRTRKSKPKDQEQTED